MSANHIYGGFGSWYKGNLHTHTEYHELGDVIKAYREYFYDFLAISNHRRCTDLEGIEEEGITLLPAIEFKGKKNPHMLGVNVTENYDKLGDEMEGDGNYQQLIDEVTAAGGFSVLAHPHYRMEDYWPLDMMKRLQGYIGIEIYNENLIKPHKPKAAHRPIATDVWDTLLSSGRKIWGFACDDFHKWGHLGRGFIVALAEDNSAASLIAAIKKGSFYASTGNLIDEISVYEDRIRISMINESCIKFIGKDGKELKRTCGFTGEYSFLGNESYLRICAINEVGRFAWTQPVFV